MLLVMMLDVYEERKWSWVDLERCVSGSRVPAYRRCKYWTDIDRFAKEFDPQKRALREPSTEQLYSETYHDDPTHNEMTR